MCCTRHGGWSIWKQVHYSEEKYTEYLQIEKVMWYKRLSKKRILERIVLFPYVQRIQGRMCYFHIFRIGLVESQYLVLKLAEDWGGRCTFSRLLWEHTYNPESHVRGISLFWLDEIRDASGKIFDWEYATPRLRVFTLFMLNKSHKTYIGKKKK